MESKLLKPQDLALYLGISINTVYSWVWSKKIPYHKIGRLVRFRLKDVEEWLTRQRIKPNPHWGEVNGDHL